MENALEYDSAYALGGVVIRITKQAYRGREFNKVRGTNVFNAPNGLLLISEVLPSVCSLSGMLYVRGSNSSQDNKLLFFEEEVDYDRFVQAVAEYNKAMNKFVNTKPIDSIVEYKGNKYKVVADGYELNSCDRCAFNDDSCGHVREFAGNCSADRRCDYTSVHFELIENSRKCLPVGSIAEIRGKKYMVEAVTDDMRKRNSCKYCDLYENPCAESLMRDVKAAGGCSACNRVDGRDIVFKLIDDSVDDASEALDIIDSAISATLTNNRYVEVVKMEYQLPVVGSEDYLRYCMLKIAMTISLMIADCAKKRCTALTYDALIYATCTIEEIASVLLRVAEACNKLKIPSALVSITEINNSKGVPMVNVELKRELVDYYKKGKHHEKV